MDNKGKDKTMKDVYIVAAFRSAVGKAPRGNFRFYHEFFSSF